MGNQFLPVRWLFFIYRQETESQAEVLADGISSVSCVKNQSAS